MLTLTQGPEASVLAGSLNPALLFEKEAGNGGLNVWCVFVGWEWLGVGGEGGLSHKADVYHQINMMPCVICHVRKMSQIAVISSIHQVF